MSLEAKGSSGLARREAFPSSCSLLCLGAYGMHGVTARLSQLSQLVSDADSACPPHKQYPCLVDPALEHAFFLSWAEAGEMAVQCASPTGLYAVEGLG